VTLHRYVHDPGSGAGSAAPAGTRSVGAPLDPTRIPVAATGQPAAGTAVNWRRHLQPGPCLHLRGRSSGLHGRALPPRHHCRSATRGAEPSAARADRRHCLDHRRHRRPGRRRAS
jgi:hypothetical protein